MGIRGNIMCKSVIRTKSQIKGNNKVDQRQQQNYHKSRDVTQCRAVLATNNTLLGFTHTHLNFCLSTYFFTHTSHTHHTNLARTHRYLKFHVQLLILFLLS